MQTLYFTPAAPVSAFALPKMMHLIGVERKDFSGVSVSDDMCVIRWEGDTKLSHQTAPTHRSVNYGCVDISKELVGDVFERVFGYNMSVDPLTYEGFIVEKSDENAAHDGRVVQAPIDRRDSSKVYQVLADSRDADGMVTDLRVPIIGRRTPLVYLKKRPVDSRFSNTNTIVRMAPMNMVFSQEEISLILKFARKIGMDYGEIDIIRDNTSKRIYIVDANKTPVGPPNHLEESLGYQALRSMGGAFKEEFLDGKYWSGQK